MKKFISRFGGIAVLLLFFGCDFMASDGEKAMRDMVEASNDLQETLHTVQDANSAQAVVATLDTKYQRLIDDTKKLIERKNDKALKSTIEELTKQSMEARAKLQAELQRLKQIHGLPNDFWKIIQMRSTDIVTTALEMAMSEQPGLSAAPINSLHELQDLWRKNGYEGVVQVKFENLSSDLSAKAIERLKKTAPDATVIQIAFEDKRSMALGPVKDYKAFLASIDFGNVTFEDEGLRSIHVTVDRTKLGARANSEAEEAQLREKDQQEFRANMEKQIAESQAQAALRMKELEKKERGPDPSDPDYYEKLADLMAGSDHFAKEKAIDALLNATPEQVPSAETRKKIARNFKKIAEGDNHFDKVKAIKGLTIWGGKYSVPILLKMLDEAHRTDQEEIIKALGDLKDPQAADALAARLGDFFTHESAYSALKQMGGGAEDALIAAGPSDNPKICLSAIELLGETGTEKSFPMLREAQTSRNVEVRNAAKAAMKKIVARQNKAKANKS
jgi:hypothetical protein